MFFKLKVSIIQCIERLFNKLDGLKKLQKIIEILLFSHKDQ